MMMNEIKNEEEKISLWSQIKEDFSVQIGRASCRERV